MKLVAFGLLLTAVVTAVIWLIWGLPAALAGGLFGLLATVIHAVSVAVLKRAWRAPFKELVKGWGIGMALRLGGAVVWMVAVLLRGDLFPALPTAIGFLGVLIPLLFTEIRFLK
ncbi:MAG: hypothetical protein JSW51_13205 [Gemmatimonadota bacterium]|nr:MAG: hypothetical protein JSW51_13205 [Gemmatimonadota bacterium]